MVADRMEDRLRAALLAHGESTVTESLGFAVDFVRLAVRALGKRALGPAERASLRRAVIARAGLGERTVDRLLDLALSPAFRAEVTPHEMRAFEARFGPGAAEALREEDRADLALGDFARRYGAGEALLLLDALFAVCGASGQVDAAELERLLPVARKLEVDGVLVAAMLRKHDPRHASGDLRFPLVGGRALIGRASSADVALPDPLVARRHAELLRVGDGWRVVDLRSGRPTVVNGVAVATAPLSEDSRLRIGPYTLRLVGDELHAFGARSFSSLSVRGLRREVDGGSLLDGVSFTVFSGEVVAIVGPSGCGKTTLLNALSGVTPADEGEVLLDGVDLHPLLAADPLLVGVVPQEDLVHAELTAAESLFYAGRLRLSADADDALVRAEVDRVLDELALDRVRDRRVGDALQRGLSGGERRRVNLGQELLAASTRVLVLDEPTSGLDPRAAHDIVRQVRQLADNGRMAFLVTHDLSPQVMAAVDHLLVLAPGGRLAWFGPPADAAAWFGVSTPDALFDRLGDRSPEAWATAWRASADARRYVSTREHLLGLGELRPRGTATLAAPVRRSSLGQLRALTARYAKVKLRDRTGLAVLAAQPLLLATVMWVVFPAVTPGLVFTVVLSALWFGMSAAVRELISDRAIWRRERRVGAGVRAWLGSKIAVLAAIVAVQCVALATIVYLATGMGGYGFSLLALGGVCALTGWTGMSLGLAVSAASRSSEAAVGALPLFLIPQIAFSAMLVTLRDMRPLAAALTWLTPQRYAFEAAIKCGEALAQASRVPGEWSRTPITGPLYELGLKPAGIGDMGMSMGALCGALVAFSAVFLAVAGGVTWARDRAQK